MSVMFSSSKMFLSSKIMYMNSVNRNLTLWKAMKSKIRRQHMDKCRNITGSKILFNENKIKVILVHGGKKFPVFAKENDSILDLVVANKINIKGYGACEGCLSCSTCHATFTSEDFKRLSMKTVEEDDMLSLTTNLTDTSRLGCQIRLTKEMDGIEVIIPDVILDIRERAPPEIDAAAA